MTSNVFIDSSLLIEYNKGAKTKLLSSLLNKPDDICYINEVVLSEFLYHFLAKNSNTSPKTLQRKNKIAEVFKTSNQFKIINLFEFLPTDANIFNLVPIYMQQYNLLPNDAIILATCKIHNITQPASHDKDFKDACKGEGIELLTEE
jgi:predicted nucleic acid-binding protein